MKIRNIMSGILAGVMTVSMGTMSVNAADTTSTTTVSTTQSTPSFVKQKTLVKGGEADYTLKAATPGPSRAVKISFNAVIRRVKFTLLLRRRVLQLLELQTVKVSVSVLSSLPS